MASKIKPSTEIYKNSWSRFKKNIFGRHKNLKQRNSRCFITTTTNTHSKETQHKNAQTSPCTSGLLFSFITTLTLTTPGLLRNNQACSKILFCGIWFWFRERETQKNFPHVMFTIPIASEWRRERSKKGKKERKERRVQVLCRSCLSFYAHTSNLRRTID